MPHTVLLCLPLVFIRYMSVCAAHRKLHFSSSPLLTAAYAYTVSACLAATAPLVRRSPCPAHYPPQGSCTATAPSIVPSFLPRPPPASATAPLPHSSAVRPASTAPPAPARSPTAHCFSHAPAPARLHTARARLSPCRCIETAVFQFFAKYFKLYRQLTERK